MTIEATEIIRQARSLAMNAPGLGLDAGRLCLLVDPDEWDSMEAYLRSFQRVASDHTEPLSLRIGNVEIRKRG